MATLTTCSLLALVALGTAFLSSLPRAVRRALRLLAVVLLVAGVVAGSWVSVADDEVGIVYRERLGKRLPVGQTIAEPGQRGPQLAVLKPGNYFRYLPFLHRVRVDKVVTVPAGRIGVVTAQDGESLSGDESFAPEWSHSDPEISDPAAMVAAEVFMAKLKKGQKTVFRGVSGVQMTVLPPGTYPVNTALFDVAIWPALHIESGSVAVIHSRVEQAPANGEPAEMINGMPLVLRGRRGIWKEVLTAGTHPAENPLAHLATIVKITQRNYDFTVSVSDHNGRTSGKITASAMGGGDWVDAPVAVRSKDGFLLPIDVHVQCTITAEHAPYVVALIGNPDAGSDDSHLLRMDRLAARVVLPALRTYFRNVAAAKSALDFVTQRQEIEEAAGAELREKLQRSYVRFDGIQIGDVHFEATDAGQKLLAAKIDFEIEAIQQKTREARREREERARADQKK